jgi:hypothetical protein
MTQALITAIFKGINDEGWKVVGHGGAWTKAIRPVEAYIQRRVIKAVAKEREACAIAGGAAAMAGLDYVEVAAAIRARRKNEISYS